MKRMGKLGTETMKKAVYSNLGRRSSRVVVGPGKGLDNAVVSLGGRRRMILTTDPVSIIPEVGLELSAWLSVHLIASDYATSGLSPQFATFSFNLPPEISEESATRYLGAIGRESKKLGVTIVAGHTGSYPGGGFTVIGAGTMFGFCNEGEYLLPSMARAGDAILMTKGAAIEATASLALSFPKFTEGKVGRRLAAGARALVRKCTVVDDALTVAAVGSREGGVTAMHDATEGGVMGGLEEMASAAGKAFVVERSSMPVFPECRAVCDAFGIDPLTSLSEGTLLLTCAGGAASEIAKALERKGIGTSEIGRVDVGEGLWVSAETKKRRVSSASDGYWEAYRRGVASHLR